MVTKMRKKIHSLLGTKKQSTGALEWGKTRTLGGQKWHQKSKKAQFYDVKYKKKQSAGALKLGDWLQIWSKKRNREISQFPIYIHI